MTRSIGILVRITKDQQPTYIIVDEEYGKFSAIAVRSDISRGSLLSYSVTQQRNKTCIHGIDVLDLPTINNEYDLIFFHQVLELVYYFLPLGKQASDIFCLLLYLYASFEQLHSDGLKKLFLSKLFAHLGFYPEGQEVNFSFFSMIRMESIEVVISRKVDLSLERKLDRWLDYCISLHPCTKYFKAISHFMSRKP